MSASISTPNLEGTDVEPDEVETGPMTDSAHLATFGWAWDDPDRVEARP